MYETLSPSDDGALGVRLTGPLEREDAERLEAALAEAVRQPGGVRLMLHLHEMDGGDRLASVLAGLGPVKRLALVGAARWEGLAGRLADRFPGAVEHFAEDDLAVAWAWVQGDALPMP